MTCCKCIFITNTVCSVAKIMLPAGLFSQCFCYKYSFVLFLKLLVVSSSWFWSDFFQCCRISLCDMQLFPAFFKTICSSVIGAIARFLWESWFGLSQKKQHGNYCLIVFKTLFKVIHFTRSTTLIQCHCFIVVIWGSSTVWLLDLLCLSVLSVCNDTQGQQERWHLGVRVRACVRLAACWGGVVKRGRWWWAPCEVSLSLSLCSISSHQLLSGMCVARAHGSRTGCAQCIFNPAGVGRSWLCMGRRLGARSPVPSEQEPAGPVGL